MRRLTFDRFTVTTELVPPRGADADACRAHAAELATFADAINITDGAGAAVRMSAVAATAFVAETGALPIVQLTVRDRNRIALAAEVLGAAALGAAGVLPLGGDPVAKGEDPDAFEVRELNAAGLARLVAELNAGRLPSGRDLDGAPPHLTIGAAAAPGMGPVAALGAKLDAGATFVQTQITLDAAGFAAWMAEARELGYHERAAFLPSIAIPASRAGAERLRSFGAQVTDEAVERAARGDGAEVAVEVLQAVLEVEGVRGVHLIGLGQPVERLQALAETARAAAAARP
jgi:methylenetetrahydrofolate reductase (NADPH)